MGPAGLGFPAWVRHRGKKLTSLFLVNLKTKRRRDTNAQQSLCVKALGYAIGYRQPID